MMVTGGVRAATATTGSKPKVAVKTNLNERRYLRIYTQPRDNLPRATDNDSRNEISRDGSIEIADWIVHFL